MVASSEAAIGRTRQLVDLADWRRRMADLYARVRAASDPAAAWRLWRAARDELFARHPQSPLTERGRAGFRGLPYFDYDRAARALATVVPTEPVSLEIATSGDGTFDERFPRERAAAVQHEALAFTRFGSARFELGGEAFALELYWLEGYGGGLYVPFADATSGATTFGGGRYLLDTVKGADLGTIGDRLVLDFNFAYNPSCSYDPRWVCPLAPPANRLPVEIRAGERV